MLLVVATLLAACGSPAQAPATRLVPQPTATATTLPTVVPTERPTATPMPIDAPTAISISSPAPTATPTIAPSPTIPKPTASAQQVCADLAAEGQRGLVVTYVQPAPNLIWDQTPRQFRVGICNTLAVPTVPQGQFVLFVYLAWTRQIRGQTSELPAQLTPGFHELLFGTWTPGLENHLSICVQRPALEIEIGYNDDFPISRSFRPVQWADGSNKMVFPIRCGGDFS